MSMHLIQGVRSTPSRKIKPKMTKGNLQRWAQEMCQYNKRARQTGDLQLTLDQYIDYVHGKGLPKKPSNFEPLNSKPSPVYRSTDHIPSADMTKATGIAAKAETKEYTGTEIVGIATLHKSNAVPVRRGTDEAKEIARMRR